LAHAVLDGGRLVYELAAGSRREVVGDSQIEPRMLRKTKCLD